MVGALTDLRLLEPLGQGGRGATWRAAVGGSARSEEFWVAVKRLPVRGTSAVRLLRRLTQAAALAEPQLLPVLSAFSRGEEVWVLSPLDDGIPLCSLMTHRRLPRACALSIALGALGGLTALHQAGLWHGALHPGNIHIGRDGRVRLGHFGLAPLSPGSMAARRAADVRAVGVILCQLLGIPTGTRRKGPKVAQTPLGAAARAMTRVAESRSGYEVARASLSLWEAGGRLAASRRQAQAKEQLAQIVERALAPAAVEDQTAPSEPTAVAPDTPWAAPPVHRSTTYRGVAMGFGAIAACALITIASFYFPGTRGTGHLQARTTPVAEQSPTLPPSDPSSLPSPDPTSTPTAPPTAAPTQGPAALGAASAGAVRAVSLLVGSGGVQVEVDLAPAGNSRSVSWVVEKVACSGAVTPIARDEVTAQPGWTRVIGMSQVSLPAGGSLVAVTRLPAQAASTPVPVGAGC